MDRAVAYDRVSKGAGEPGAAGSLPSAVNVVLDLDLPMTPQWMWLALQQRHSIDQ
jgi:hypothetical protein